MRVHCLPWVFFLLIFRFLIKHLLTSLFSQHLHKHIEDQGKLFHPLGGQEGHIGEKWEAASCGSSKSATGKPPQKVSCRSQSSGHQTTGLQQKQPGQVLVPDKPHI